MSLPLPSAPRHRMSSDQRRQAIVDAAVELFAQNGFRGTTTRQIAQAVGVTEPVLYMHFQTKRDLYTAIIEKMAERRTPPRCLATGEAVTDDEFFRNLAEEVLDWHVEDATRIRLLLFSALEGHELAELFYERHFVPFLQALAGYIRKGIDEGRFRTVDPQTAARAFLGMTSQFGQGITVFARTCEPEERKRILAGMVEIFLSGIRKPEGENQ